MTSQRAGRLVGVLGAATTAVSIGGLSWLTSGLRATAARGGTTLDEALGLVAVLGCWVCVGWFLLAVACSAAAAAPGVVGRSCSAAAEVLAPWTLRKIVAAGLGLTVVTGPAAAAAAGPMQLQVAPAAAGTLVDRSPTRLGTDLPPLDRPADPAYVVTVRPGDCLWLIAARQLGPQATDAEIAAAWPDWYATNRWVIGADPNLLLPGQRLVAPGRPS